MLFSFLSRTPYPILMIELFNFDKSHGIVTNLHGIYASLIGFMVLLA